MNEQNTLLRLLTLVLCDRLPRHPLPRYLVGETDDNRPAVLMRVCDAKLPEWQINPPPIAITGGQTTGYSGTDSWIEAMVVGGIKRNRICVVPMAEPLNTFTEMLALVRYAEQTAGWNALAIVAAPFHQLRAFLSVVGAMKRLGRLNPPTLWVYNVPGVALPWGEVALHSQGEVRDRRVGLIDAELERIRTYTAKGDLPPAEEALSYLWLRDRSNP
ncbi:MAG: hypothetical protein PHI63_03130 [Patescibacteria group bacterium]|nr:hypothetical protein [Patescibacteria group bacterium]